MTPRPISEQFSILGFFLFLDERQSPLYFLVGLSYWCETASLAGKQGHSSSSCNLTCTMQRLPMLLPKSQPKSKKTMFNLLSQEFVGCMSCNCTRNAGEAGQRSASMLHNLDPAPRYRLYADNRLEPHPDVHPDMLLGKSSCLFPWDIYHSNETPLLCICIWIGSWAGPTGLPHPDLLRRCR